MRLLYVAFFFLIAFVNAQTTVTTTNTRGTTIVQVVSTDGVRGPITSIISTITGAAPVVALPTETDREGPVGAPPATTGTPYLPTPFIYTTTIDGEVLVRTGTFTPTSEATVNVTYASSGTVLAYSDYTALFGTPISGSTHTLVCPLASMAIAFTSTVYLIL